MDGLQADGGRPADGVFTPERLAAQQTQILRRLEQLDQPARVISFPAASRPEPHGLGGRRVAVSWVGVAAAAGLVIGLVGGQARRAIGQAVRPASATTADAGALATSDAATGPVNNAVLARTVRDARHQRVGGPDDMTPTLTEASARSALARDCGARTIAGRAPDHLPQGPGHERGRRRRTRGRRTTPPSSRAVKADGVRAADGPADAASREASSASATASTAPWTTPIRRASASRTAGCS